ncbi:MAG TPA: TIGR03435 family protein [Candidatus Acidoferrales bacterium]|nr:TIGR03435 family protein [Candidatus Acidoferrales bacterium]
MLKKSVILNAIIFFAAVGALCQAQSQSQSAAQPWPQAQNDASLKLEFDVATVKPSPPNEQSAGIKPLPGGQTYVATGVPVRLMIRLMFHLTPNQISGGPSWLDSDLYDVTAKADRPRNIDELHIMFQNLLIDRFKLQFHTDTKEMSAYTLAVDKSGSKITPNTGPEPFDIPYSGVGFGKLKFTHVSMSYFTWFLAGFPPIGRPVVDGTDLKGFYDFTLEWAPELPPGVDPEVVAKLPPTNGLDIFAAIQKELGLKLEPGKAQVAVMVIDHAEKPTDDN